MNVSTYFWLCFKKNLLKIKIDPESSKNHEYFNFTSIMNWQNHHKYHNQFKLPVQIPEKKGVIFWK